MCIRDRIYPANRFCNRIRRLHSRATTPSLQRFVTVLKDSDVIAGVLIELGVGVYKAKLAAQELHVVRGTGQEQPTRLHLMHFSVVFESRHSILFRFQRERIKEDILADAIAK